MLDSHLGRAHPGGAPDHVAELELRSRRRAGLETEVQTVHHVSSDQPAMRFPLERKLGREHLGGHMASHKDLTSHPVTRAASRRQDTRWRAQGAATGR